MMGVRHRKDAELPDAADPGPGKGNGKARSLRSGAADPGLSPGDIVRSEAGRDGGRYFMVIAVEQEYVRLCDGDYRRMERPKRKKRKHVQLVGADDGPVRAKLGKGESVQNSEVRRALRAFFTQATE